MATFLPPLPVVCPIAMAALLLAGSHFAKRPIPDIAALITAVTAGVFSALMLEPSLHAPLIYWFGEWAPLHGFVPGIGFVVDPPGVMVSVFIALLFSATFIFAWGYYDEVHAHFHVLMLIFLGGMIGFCLTHDLFDMFVWFEVMSIAGFSLTGYQLRSSALEGAINFAVINAVGSYLFLSGIGLLYIRIGALDFSALARGVASSPSDPAILAAFVLIGTGLLVKAAQTPFHFWLSDAHAVAPSPVSVVFSGMMVALGIFGLGRLCWLVFMGSDEIRRVIHGLLSWIGLVSVLLGGVMSLLQRHIKRLLAFSTISHTGMLLVGLASLSSGGLAGMVTYLLGHRLVKASLFMVSGVLLAVCGGIDELGLRGAGKRIWPAGVVMAAGGLLLAGMPMGLMANGGDYILDTQGVGFGCLLLLGSACTGGAVLRVSGRVFLGLGKVAGEEKRAPTDAEREKADRPLWLMLWPAIVLLALALVTPPGWNYLLSRSLTSWIHPPDHAVLGLTGSDPTTSIPLQAPFSSPMTWVATILAVGLAAFDLFRESLPHFVTRFLDKILTPLLDQLQVQHSGDIRDYVSWLCFGLALLSLAFLLLR